MLALQFLANGLVAGAIYALMTAGFAVIYNSTRILHVAHGAIFSLAGYCFVVATGILGLAWPIGGAVAVALAATAGVLLELLLYRPLRDRGAGPGALLIVSLGAFIVLQHVFILFFSNQTQVIRRGSLPTVEMGAVRLTTLSLGMLVVVGVVFLLLHLFFARSALGRALRALADNYDLAFLLGFPIQALYLAVFALGSALAGVAAVLLALDIGVRPELGLSVVLIAIVAVIIGGVGQIGGAAVAAILLGVVQNLAVWQLSSAWQETVVFAVLILFLILRPQGLFGAAIQTRRS